MDLTHLCHRGMNWKETCVDDVGNDGCVVEKFRKAWAEVSSTKGCGQGPQRLVRKTANKEWTRKHKHMAFAWVVDGVWSLSPNDD